MYQLSVDKITKSKILKLVFLYALSFVCAHQLVHAGYFPMIDNSHYGSLPDPAGDNGTLQGVDKLEVVVRSVLRNVRLIIGTIAVAFLVYAGGTIAARGGDEGAISTSKSTITYVLVGFVVIALAGAASELLSVKDGGFLNPDVAKERAVSFRTEVNLVITFVRYILGSVSVLFIVISGLGLVTKGDEDSVTAAKNRLIASISGLLILIFSTVFIDKVFYVVDLNAKTTGIEPQVDVARGIAEMVAVTNIVVSIVGPIMILLLIGGGLMYILSFGDEGKTETSKNIIKNSFIGIIVMYGAFAVVSTFISGFID